MSDVKRAIRGIPPKQDKEGPASDKQIGYLRSFGYFPEKLIADLGMWQASYLIDKAMQIKESEENEPRQRLRGKTKPTQYSLGGCLILIVGALIVGTVLTQTCGHKSTVSEIPPARRTVTPPKFAKPPELPEINPPPTEEPPTVPIKPIIPQLPGIASFEGMTLPVSVVVIESFSLLGSTGKETTMPIGAIIKVTNRTERGTLTMENKGALFVGNEARLIHKVKAQ